MAIINGPWKQQQEEQAVKEVHYYYHDNVAEKEEEVSGFWSKIPLSMRLVLIFVSLCIISETVSLLRLALIG